VAPRDYIAEPNCKRDSWNPSEAYNHHTSQAEAAWLGYTAFIDTAWDERYGVFLAYVEHQQQMWDVEAAMQ
jgi:hypothetical protein